MNIQGGLGQIQVGVGPGGMGGPGGMQGAVGLGPMQGPGVMQGIVGPGMPGGLGGPVMQGPAGMMHGPSPQNPGTPQQMQGNMPQQPQEKLDNISKVKSLMLPLRESLSVTLKTAAQTLHQNSLIDAGSTKGVDATIPRFDKNLEDFYSICDQIELHLKTSAECITQGASSARYLPFMVAPTRNEPMAAQDSNTLTYPQYLATAKAQVSYAKDIHDSLTATAQNIIPNE